MLSIQESAQEGPPVLVDGIARISLGRGLQYSVLTSLDNVTFQPANDAVRSSPHPTFEDD
jgi:hypothetical protein